MNWETGENVDKQNIWFGELKAKRSPEKSSRIFSPLLCAANLRSGFNLLSVKFWSRGVRSRKKLILKYFRSFYSCFSRRCFAYLACRIGSFRSRTINPLFYAIRSSRRRSTKVRSENYAMARCSGKTRTTRCFQDQPSKAFRQPCKSLFA